MTFQEKPILSPAPLGTTDLPSIISTECGFLTKSPDSTIWVLKENIKEVPPMCPVHKVGDKIIINNGCLEEKICLPVLSQQIARLYGLVNGMASANVITYRCPDQAKVAYEIRRDPDHWWKDALSPLTEAEVKPYVP